MRKLGFYDLNLNQSFNEESFYQYYIENIPQYLNSNNEFNMPDKKYEIFYLDILGGKIILLNKKYLPNSNDINQELFYDYKIALDVYNYLVDIYDGIEKESFEFNELYKSDRLDKDSKINKLKLKDNELFNTVVNEYNIITNSQMYKKYLNLLTENEKLQAENTNLIEENNKLKITNKELLSNNTNNKINFLQKILNSFSRKKLLNNGEKHD